MRRASAIGAVPMPTTATTTPGERGSIGGGGSCDKPLEQRGTKVAGGRRRRYELAGKSELARAARRARDRAPAPVRRRGGGVTVGSGAAIADATGVSTVTRR